jgi:transcriptional regulator with XRE-family HTH domain
MKPCGYTNGREFLQKLGRLVRELRLDKGYSQRRLERILKLHSGALSRLEAGKRCPNNIQAILDYFSIVIEPRVAGDQVVEFTCKRCLARDRIRL